jgi:hypothetical protein
MKNVTRGLLALVLLGCSSNPPPDQAQPTATAVATAEPTAQPTAEPTAAPTATATATASTPPPPPAPEPAADLAVVAMKIVFDPKTTLELKADKGLYAKGKKIATFDKNVLQLTEMKDNMAVLKDGTILSSPPFRKTLKLNDKDELEIEGGGKIAIDDKGKVTLTLPDSADPKKTPKPTITGFKPEGRRAALLTLLLAMQSTGEPAPAPPPVKREDTKPPPPPAATATASAKPAPAPAPAPAPKK